MVKADEVCSTSKDDIRETVREKNDVKPIFDDEGGFLEACSESEKAKKEGRCVVKKLQDLVHGAEQKSTKDGKSLSVLTLT